LSYLICPYLSIIFFLFLAYFFFLRARDGAIAPASSARVAGQKSVRATVGQDRIATPRVVRAVGVVDGDLDRVATLNRDWSLLRSRKPYPSDIVGGAVAVVVAASARRLRPPGVPQESAPVSRLGRSWYG